MEYRAAGFRSFSVSRSDGVRKEQGHYRQRYDRESFEHGLHERSGLYGYRPSRRRLVRKAIGVVLVVSAAMAMAVFTCFGVPQLFLGSAHEGSAGAVLMGESSEGPSSTPQDEWHQGVVPSLYQTDPAWASSPYAGATVEKNGCGPTCLAMVYVAVTGQKDQTPELIARWADSQGFAKGGETSWALMSDGAAHFGLVSHEVPADVERLAQELWRGNPIICSMAPGDFTTVGHFIVLSGMDDEGQVMVHDPNSPERSTVWDAQKILSQCRSIWAFEAA